MKIGAKASIAIRALSVRCQDSQGDHTVDLFLRSTSNVAVAYMPGKQSCSQQSVKIMRRFSLKSLMILLAFSAVCWGWFADHRRLQREVAIEREYNFMSGLDWQQRRTRIAQVCAQSDPPVAMLLFALSDPDKLVRQQALARLKSIPPQTYSIDYSKDRSELCEFERWFNNKNMPGVTDDKSTTVVRVKTEIPEEMMRDLFPDSTVGRCY